MDELPYKLKVKVAMQIYRELYLEIKLFQGKPESFILWIGTQLRPQLIYEKDYIFKEGESIRDIYFLVKG